MGIPTSWTICNDVSVVTTCRFELFVADLDVSVRFYADVLDFAVERRETAYVSLARDHARIGLGLVSELPEDGAGPGFTQDRVAQCAGAGVELVIVASDLDELHARVVARNHPLVEPLQRRPWGLMDFRLVDPDGYYLRITHP